MLVVIVSMLIGLVAIAYILSRVGYVIFLRELNQCSPEGVCVPIDSQRMLDQPIVPGRVLLFRPTEHQKTEDPTCHVHSVGMVGGAVIGATELL